MEKIILENKEWIDKVWEKADKKLRNTAVKNENKIPYTTVNGVYNNMAEDDVTWWTNGFWAGLMWLMYVDTKEECYKKTAQRAEELLDKAFLQYDKLHHDVGFMWHISAGVNYRLFGGEKSRLRAVYALNTLAGRYNPEGKYIRAWNEDKVGWVIIDCMMNINMLHWGSEEFNDPRYRYIAENHADTTIKTHIRPDGSSHHIVNLDCKTGEPLEVFGGQGYGEGSSWSRGQAWALYGFILNYIHSGKTEYLATAKKAAHYFVSNVCDDWLPRSDFRAPEEPIVYDSTAGAIAACGLIEIANSVPEYEKRFYLDAALKLLKTMEETWCDWSETEESILQMGTEAYNREHGKHIPIIYGDYFFIEALYKLRGNTMLFW